MTSESRGKPPTADTALVAALDGFVVRYQRWVETDLQRQGLTGARMRLLVLLHCDVPPTMSRLATLLDVTPRNVTGLVDALEADGLAQRSHRDGDRRVTVIRLTERGRHVLEEYHDRHVAAASSLLSDLDDEERGTLARVLGVVEERMRAAGPVTAGGQAVAGR